jgi:hypothetical protein
MGQVVVAEGGEPSPGQSRFALARGTTFESTLFRDNAARLREELEMVGLLEPGMTGFKDFRLRRVGGTQKDLDSARAATTATLEELGRTTPASHTEFPSILAGPTIRVPGGAMLPEAILCIDVLVVLPRSPWTLVVGEIKTYPDRGGYTDRTELATARAQAGIYVHGLREVLAELGLGSTMAVSSEGFLVLTRPGYSQPKIRAREDLEFQAERARRGLERLRAVAAQLSFDEEGEPRNPIGAIRAAPTRYCEDCIRFCDRANICRARAAEAGDPAILGRDAERLLGDISVNRALSLLSGERPDTQAERDLLRRLRATTAGGRA